MASLADITDPETQPLTETKLQAYINRLNSQRWSVSDDGHLRGSYSFDDFATALEFVTEVGDVAEQMWHHPDITLRWGEVVVEVWSHDVNALQEIDFVLAARCNRRYQQQLAE